MRAQMRHFTMPPPFSLLESLPGPKVPSCQVLPWMLWLSGCPAQLRKLCQDWVKPSSCWEEQKWSPWKQAPHQSCSESQDHWDTQETRVPGKTTPFPLRRDNYILENQDILENQAASKIEEIAQVASTFEFRPRSYVTWDCEGKKVPVYVDFAIVASSTGCNSMSEGEENLGVIYLKL